LKIKIEDIVVLESAKGLNNFCKRQAGGGHSGITFGLDACILSLESQWLSSAQIILRRWVPIFDGMPVAACVSSL